MRAFLLLIMKDKKQTVVDELLLKRKELLLRKEAAQELCDMPMLQHYRMMIQQVNDDIASLKQKRTL